MVEFIESRSFTRRLGELTGHQADEVLQEIQDDLLKNPNSGDLVRGLGGVRKARAADPIRGKGKRGGYRYMHLYLEHKGHIHLLFLFGKDEQEDLTNDERRVIRQMVVELKKE